MRFLSVCSGIEAASVAWNPLGWQAVAFSEIEKFPSAVLAHHYPDVPNLGDFTKIDTATLGPVDILSGGTPCQAFSVAGLRQSLDDARGNLSLSFVRLAHELAAGNGLRNVVWENVPGVLSTKDNAFGCFLGALVGADDALPSPAGKRWPDAGMVDGPKGRAAWRILDAQYFGLAQRRRRVIVVADFGIGADPAAVLFERASLSGNTPPSREAGESFTHPVANSLTASGRGVERPGDTRGQDPVVATYAIQAGALRENPDSGPDGVGVQPRIAYTLEARAEVQAVSYAPEIARCVATREGSSQDYETTTMVVEPIVYSIMPQNSGKDYKARVVDVAQPLMAGGPTGGNQGGDYVVEAVCVTGNITHALKAEGADASEDGTGRGNPIVVHGTQDPCVDEHVAFALGRNSGQENAIAFSAKDYGADATLNLSPTLRAGGHTGSHANAGVMPAVAYTVALRGREGGGTAELGGDVATALRASTGGGDKPHVLVGDGCLTPWDSQQKRIYDSSAAVAPALSGVDSAGGRQPPAYSFGSAVRRLTPRECERLQGFDDDYTLIPYRNKLAADGPRYKALGNSWAVPKFVWLGRRIAALMPVAAANDNTSNTESQVA